MPLGHKSEPHCRSRGSSFPCWPVRLLLVGCSRFLSCRDRTTQDARAEDVAEAPYQALDSRRLHTFPLL